MVKGLTGAANVTSVIQHLHHPAAVPLSVAGLFTYHGRPYNCYPCRFTPWMRLLITKATSQQSIVESKWQLSQCRMSVLLSPRLRSVLCSPLRQFGLLCLLMPAWLADGAQPNRRRHDSAVGLHGSQHDCCPEVWPLPRSRRDRCWLTHIARRCHRCLHRSAVCRSQGRLLTVVAVVDH